MKKEIITIKEEGIQMTGVYVIEDINVDTWVINTDMKKNVLLEGLFEKLLAFMNYSEEVLPPTLTDLNITHIALGTGTTSAFKTDTGLETETFRKAYTTKVVTSKEKITVLIALSETEANFTIKEIGIVADGTATLDSGLYLSRINVDKEKNSGKRLNIIWTLTLVR